MCLDFWTLYPIMIFACLAAPLVFLGVVAIRERRAKARRNVSAVAEYIRERNRRTRRHGGR